MTQLIKSIRIDEDISKRIGTDVNFSALANQALKEHLNKRVWLPNLQIEKHAGIAPSVLIERMTNVKFLRSSNTAVSFTLYPTSEKEIDRNKAIFQYANGSNNSLHDGFVYFNVEFPVNFLLFLKSRNWDEVQRCVTGFVCLLYWIDPERRQILEEQIERKVLKYIVKTFNSSDFDGLKKAQKLYLKKQTTQLRSQYHSEFFKLAVTLGIDPIVMPYMGNVFSHIYYPYDMREIIPFENNGFEIRMTSGYMRDIYEEKDDWTSIVLNGQRKGDDLQRSESLSEPWENWRSEYVLYHDIH